MEGSIEAPLCAGFLDRATWGSELSTREGRALGDREHRWEASELESRAWEGGRRPWGGMYWALVAWTHPVGGPHHLNPAWTSIKSHTLSSTGGLIFFFQLLVTVQPLVESWELHFMAASTRVLGLAARSFF